MAIASLRKSLTSPATRWSDPKMVLWYGLSLALALYYGWLVLQSAFSTPYVIQDDARQHVFWMQRLVEPGLLPGDFMADYFASRAPLGYTWVYQGAAALGLHPFTFNKLLPPFLGVLGTHYCFRLSIQLLPIPVTAFTSTLLLNQSLWMKDDLASGTPRAFLYVLLLAFLVYVNQRAVVPCLVVVALQPFFYPHCALLSAGILVLRLGQVKQGRLCWSRESQDYVLAGCGVGVLVLLLAPYAIEQSAFGPLITPAVARQMPEFWSGGRAAYFRDNPLLFWFSDRAGFIPTPVLTPPTLAFSLFFPWLWWRARRHPWMQTIRTHAAILQQLVLTSVGLYFAAHLMLFTLHLPSRYTHHSLRIVFALTASFTIWIFLDKLLRVLEGTIATPKLLLQKGLACMGIVLTMVGLLGYSSLTQSFPFMNNRYGTLPDLYQFLRSTPKDTVIASLTEETSNLHVFAQRSPLISPELGLPYHTGYYQEFRQRTVDLIEAQYSRDWAVVQRFIEQYDIDYWLLNDRAFVAADLREYEWLQQYQPEAEQAIAALEKDDAPPILEIAKSSCTVLQTTAQVNQKEDMAKKYWLLDANCILNLSSE